MFIPQNPLLEPQLSEPALRALLEHSTGTLAQATRPSCIAHKHSTVQWTAEKWDQQMAQRADIFDEAALADQFNYDDYLRDGYAILKGIMTPQAIEDWTTAV